MKTAITTLILCLCASLAMAQGLTLEEQHKLDTFFSNFSEAGVSSFTEETLTPDELLYFALQHAFINSFDKLEQTPDGNWVSIPAALVDKITRKYFNRVLEGHVQAAYLYPIAFGESYTFSQVSMINHMGENFYYAEGPIYSAGSGSVIDPHATPEQWQSEGEDVEQIASFQATYEKTGNGYILLTYDYIPDPAIECPFVKLSTNMVSGEYMGVYYDGGACYASVTSNAGGDFLDILCGDIEQVLGTEGGRQVNVLFMIAQYWNGPAGTCDTAPFFVWGNEAN